MDNQHNPFQCNLGYQVSLSGVVSGIKSATTLAQCFWKKFKTDLATGKKPYRLQLVGLVFGGKPVEDFAHDFWSLSPATGGEACGFITSPWYHPDIKQNIAMGYVPFDGIWIKTVFQKEKSDKNSRHTCPMIRRYAGCAVDAEVVPMPFTPSHYAILGKKHSSDMRTRLAAV